MSQANVFATEYLQDPMVHMLIFRNIFEHFSKNSNWRTLRGVNYFRPKIWIAKQIFQFNLLASLSGAQVGSINEEEKNSTNLVTLPLLRTKTEALEWSIC